MYSQRRLAVEIVMMCSISTFSYKTLKGCVYLSIWLICFGFICPNYSDANDLSSQALTNSNLSGNNRPFSFVVWGHPRGIDDKDPPLHLDEFIELTKELKPDFIVITGDMIQGRIGRIEEQEELIESDWNFFDKCVKEIGVPIYRLPGNHDVSNKTTYTIYSKRYTPPPYSFTYEGSRFVLLDSIGMKQRLNDSSAYWGHGAEPFDEEQIDFIKNEIRNQDKYHHLFFFMHHTSPWKESSSFWWDQIHPMLVKGKTRAVFSGDNPSFMKFAHMEQDGIHYLLNNNFPTMESNFFKKWPEQIHIMRQLDNVQFVQVNGNKVKYKTHVLAELKKESMSWRYYDKIENEVSTWQKDIVAKLNAKLFYSIRRIVLVFTIWGGVCFLFGILFIIVIKRFKNNQS